MKYAVVYVSKSGNTKLLAEEVKKLIPKEECVFFGAPDCRACDADVVFAGFWTDKGGADQVMLDFLGRLSGKKICLFGTAGFGGSIEYFDKILGRIVNGIPQGNEITEGFMCQGKMHESVRKRYEAMLEQNPSDEKIKGMIENYDEARNHPDRNDFDHLRTWAGKIIGQNQK